MDLTKEQRDAWDAWIAERPPAIRVVAERIPPWHKYRMRSTGQIVTLAAYEEGDDGSCTTVRVRIDPEDNPDRAMFFARSVFGIAWDDLELAPLPTPPTEES